MRWKTGGAARSLAKAIAGYEAAGESLDPALFLTPPVPDEKNFGSTPLLDGIMTPDTADADAVATASQKLDRLYGLFHPAKRNRFPRGQSLKISSTDEPPTIVDWKKRRQTLKESPYIPPEDDPSDQRAVYLALEPEKALFDELISASRRPHAIFSPSDRRRRFEELESSRLAPENQIS